MIHLVKTVVRRPQPRNKYRPIVWNEETRYYVVNVTEGRNCEPLATSQLVRSKRSAVKNILAQRLSFPFGAVTNSVLYQDDTGLKPKMCFALPMFENSKQVGFKILPANKPAGKKYTPKKH